MTIIEEKYAWGAEPVPREKTLFIVLHHVGVAGSFSAQDIHRMHLRNGWRGIAYHYYIRRDGTVYRGRPENTIGGHTSGYNDRSIGVCFEGNFETETLTAAAYQAGLRLVAELQRRYPGAAVVGHRELTATACPGKNFPLSDMRKAKETVPMFTDIETHWAKPYIERCAEAGLVKGRDTDTFAPDEPVSRAELCVILSRYMDKEAKA